MSTAQSFEAMLADVWRRTDELFAMLSPQALLERPISLRHPFLFYVGHLPAFAWNQIARGVLEHGPLHSGLDALFERGIDPGSEADAKAASRSSWPSLEEVVAYRDDVRRAVLSRIPAVLERAGDPLCERGRVLHLVVEHELMHHETLVYMFQEHAPFATKPPRRPRSSAAPAPPPSAGTSPRARQ